MQVKGQQRHTKSESLVPVKDVLAVHAHDGEAELLGYLNGIVVVLKSLHVSSHLLEGFLVHLIPVYNTGLDLVKQLCVCVCVCVCVCM